MYEESCHDKSKVLDITKSCGYSSLLYDAGSILISILKASSNDNPDKFYCLDMYPSRPGSLCINVYSRNKISKEDLLSIEFDIQKKYLHLTGTTLFCSSSRYYFVNCVEISDYVVRSSYYRKTILHKGKVYLMEQGTYNDAFNYIEGLN